MKQLFTLILAVMFQLICLTVSGQVRVTGHATAEVVESVSASNSFNQNIAINGTGNRVNLGSVRLTGASDAACDVRINNTTIKNEAANYTLETSYNEELQNTGKSKEISLSAVINQNVVSGRYDGRLTVIVSYN